MSVRNYEKKTTKKKANLTKQIKILPTSHKAQGEAAVYNTFKLNRHEKNNCA